MKEVKKTEGSSNQISTLKPYTIMLLKDNLVSVTPEDAWNNGTNIRTAMKDSPSMIRGWIMAEVGRLCKEMSMKTTIASDEELIFCVRSIIEEHPTIKIEEIRACFDMIRKGKFGKLYERLKTPEILEFLRRYEGEVRCDIIERQMHRQRHEHEQQARERIGESRVSDIVNQLPDAPREKVDGHGVGSRLRKDLDNYVPLTKEQEMELIAQQQGK